MYDAIIVGARCAGHRWRCYSRARLSSATVRQSHFPERHDLHTPIHQPGVARLKHWGFLKRFKPRTAPRLSR